MDYWSFSGRAGDRLVVALETPGNPGSSGLYCRVERPDGGTLEDFYAAANGTGQLPPVVLPASGRYVVRVSYYYNYTGEYRLRVTLAPPPWQLESEDNNSVAQAKAPAFPRQGTNQTARVLGYLRAGDPGDVFWLGNLSEATQIRMAYRLPGTSMLVGIAEVLDNSGAVVASAAAGETNLNYTVPMAQGGAYYVRMRAQAGTTGLFSQYLLSIELSDLLPPAIVADSLPAEGTTSLALFDRFTLTFSEDLLASSVNAADTFDLRAAGADGLFDTVDDLLVGVTVSPAYSSGLTANFTISGGALQPGLYRFITRTTLQDRAGNSLASAWTRQFVIGQVAGFNTELEPNNTRETATALAMMSTQPNLISGAGRGYLANGSDVDFYRFEALAGM